MGRFLPEIHGNPHNYSMHIDWARVLAFVYENRLSISATFGAIVTAGVITSPESIPRTAQDLWTWGREWSNQLLNTKRMGK